MYKSWFLPVRLQDRVQPSVKAGESDMRFRKRSVLWFCTSFIAQIIAYIHCFPHWTTSIPFLGLLRIDSADSRLCQDFFQIIIFLCTDSPHSFSEIRLCHLLSAPSGSPSGLTLCLCRAQNSIGCCGTKYNEDEDARLWQNSPGKSLPLLLPNSPLRVWLCLCWLLKAKPA